MKSASTFNAAYYRSYSRLSLNGVRENYEDTVNRVVDGLQKIGKLDENETSKLKSAMLKLEATASGRALWYAGTESSFKPHNYYGLYNCVSIHTESFHALELLFYLQMLGCGVGAVLEQKLVDKLPKIENYLDLQWKGNIGDKEPSQRQENTTVKCLDNHTVEIVVGDSKEGWSNFYRQLLELAINCDYCEQNGIDICGTVTVVADISNIRGKGEKLKGFGGTANPSYFKKCFEKVVKTLNKSAGRKLTQLEVTLLIDEPALLVVSGNVRRCLPEYALVHTSKGLVPMEDVQPGDLVQTPLGFRKVVDKFDQGMQNVYQLKTVEYNGEVPKATLNHRYAVLDNATGEYTWKKVSELESGDGLLYNETIQDKSISESNIPVTFKGLGSVDFVQTYDIEVEDAHCFYCDGYLTHNSAGIRQYDHNSPLYKQDLWQPGSDGVWRIDPERDALRMANHTRNYHSKPDYKEVKDAVTSQFTSGEGAINYVPEVLARTNADLITDYQLKNEFIEAYENGKGKEYLASLNPDITDAELAHRINRYGTNPCIPGDTWIHTENGPRKVDELIGEQTNVYVNGELFNTTKDGFFYTGTKETVNLDTKEGYSLRLTPDHKVLKVTKSTSKKEYTEWVETKDLAPGDQIKIHDHSSIEYWSGNGTYGQGWLLGNLIGDGCLANTEWNDVGILRYWGENQKYMAAYALELAQKELGYTGSIMYHKTHGYYQLSTVKLAELAKEYGIVKGHKHITEEIEKGSYQFYCGFLRGFFDADGSPQGYIKHGRKNGRSIRLTQSNLQDLQAVQRMLLRLGVACIIYKNRSNEGYNLLPDSNRNPKYYKVKAGHELSITKENMAVFEEKVGFKDPTKKDKLKQILASYTKPMYKEKFVATVESIVQGNLESVYDCTVPQIHQFDGNGAVISNCSEIEGSDFLCNLSEVYLNNLDPSDMDSQKQAFEAATLAVAALLHQNFPDKRMQYSRELDPIVGVGITGLFDFFVNAIGVDYAQWMVENRPMDDKTRGPVYVELEQRYLNLWYRWVEDTITEYCNKHGLKKPNRFTCVKPSGTLSLLTGASPGWHPPKASHMIRRITFSKEDPIALAYNAMGYRITPAHGDTDENGNLLDDPWDSRVNEWLVEIPITTTWGHLEGADEIKLENIPATAQMALWETVQKYWTGHNTSATVELRENEIDSLSEYIYNSIQDPKGAYTSVALLARFDDYQSFPRLPFEPISKNEYKQRMAEIEQNRVFEDFHEALAYFDQYYLNQDQVQGPSGCDSDKCMIS